MAHYQLRKLNLQSVPYLAYKILLLELLKSVQLDLTSLKPHQYSALSVASQICLKPKYTSNCLVFLQYLVVPTSSSLHHNLHDDGSEPDHESSKIEHDDSNIEKYGPPVQACLGASAINDQATDRLRPSRIVYEWSMSLYGLILVTYWIGRCVKNSKEISI
ncbi:hypothetical protein F2Q69_00035089 [Brassica cretica]|uniref:Uncharacterized protein n=1 Tax=Brassica cretica TaxID=69181 RepID=A0A8S9SEH7_BRACR|nr:hypothetical protein F2Q69_00035089 [Brassica cretica]